MSPRAAILYLWDLFDKGRIAGPVIVAACAVVTAHHHAVLDRYDHKAIACYTKAELDKLAGL